MDETRQKKHRKQSNWREISVYHPLSHRTYKSIERLDIVTRKKFTQAT